MDESQVKAIIEQVVHRLFLRMGANGSLGGLVIVLSGATAGFTHVLSLLPRLVLQGYVLNICVSKNAEAIVGFRLREHLTGVPNVHFLADHDWFAPVRQAKAVVVPLLSLSTLSKVSQFIGDTPCANCIIHSLFLQKPIVMAVDGADPQGEHWGALPGTGLAPSMIQAVMARIKTLESYGCHFTRAEGMFEYLQRCLSQNQPGLSTVANPDIKRYRGKVITAGVVRDISRSGQILQVHPKAVLTPSAKDLAVRYRIQIVRNGHEQGVPQ